MFNKKNIILGLIAVLAVSFVLELLFAEPHHHNIWNTMPGFDILFGIAAAVGIIFVAKGVIAGMLQRDENYYEDGGEDDAY